MARELSTNMVVTFFLDKAATAAEIKDIEQKVLGSPLVSGVKVVGAEEARDRFQKNFPDLKDILANLKINPFPPSLEARLKDTAPASREVAKLVQDVRQMKGVEDVQFNQDWVDKMQSLSRLAKAVGFFLGGILMLASFFIISNVIKLNVIARKNEIEILRLVGATNIFIRIPFLFEGIALGVDGKHGLAGLPSVGDQALPRLYRFSRGAAAALELPLPFSLPGAGARRRRRGHRLPGQSQLGIEVSEDLKALGGLCQESSTEASGLGRCPRTRHQNQYPVLRKTVVRSRPFFSF